MLFRGVPKPHCLLYTIRFDFDTDGEKLPSYSISALSFFCGLGVLRGEFLSVSCLGQRQADADLRTAFGVGFEAHPATELGSSLLNASQAEAKFVCVFG